MLDETLNEVLGNTTSSDFFDTIRKMVAKLQDGHGYVYDIPSHKLGGLPIRVDWIEDNVVVLVTDSPLFQKGDIIKSVDGTSGIEVLLKEEKFDRETTRINPTSDIIPYLIENTVTSAQWHIPQIIYPDRKDLTFAQSNWPINPKSPHFKSEVVFINDPFVVSSGETVMGIIEFYKLAELVGGTTAGCNGNANFIPLAGGYKIMFTGMKVLKHDGSQHHLLGIKPTYPVSKTIKAVLEKRDEYLDKAIEVILGKS